MKKLFLIAGIVALSTGTYAQTSFGIHAGINMASMKFDDDQGTDIKSKLGFVIGALAEVDFGSSISFRPELNFIQKGFKIDEQGIEYNETHNYIELSPNFVYNVPAGAGKAYFGVGPSFGFAMSGKSKLKVDGEDEEKNDIEFGSDELKDDYKGFDYGLNILAGYRLPMGLTFTAAYNLGLADLNVSDDDNNSMKTRGFSFKIGYMFGGTKAAADDK